MTTIFQETATWDGAPAQGIVARLDAVQGQWPSVDSIAYLDVKHGLLLGVSSHPGRRRETIDGACLKAAELSARVGSAEGSIVVATRRDLIVYRTLPESTDFALLVSFDCAVPSSVARAVTDSIAEEWAQ